MVHRLTAGLVLIVLVTVGAFAYILATRMVNGLTAGLILIVLVSVTVCAYLIAWRGRRSSVRRGASLIVACVSSLVGLFATVAYAIPALDDFRNPAVPFSEAVVGNLIMWAI
jgi:hypothetical protein